MKELKAEISSNDRKNNGLKAGLTFLKCSNSDKNYCILDQKFIDELILQLSPFTGKVKFVQLSSPELKKTIKIALKKVPEIKEIIEEKKEMLKLIDEIVCNEIKENDDYIEINAKNEDYEVIVKDFSFNLDGVEKLTVKIFEGEE